MSVTFLRDLSLLCTVFSISPLYAADSASYALSSSHLFLSSLHRLLTSLSLLLYCAMT